jgi:hypothetical protein
MSSRVTKLTTLDPRVEPPEVSIVVPCLNEEITIGEFVDWCHEGLAAADVRGEVLIIDSSSDRSPIIAAERGARVITVPKRGLGQAYIDAISQVLGDIVIMGDCDLTYDFRELYGFIEAIRDGHDFVMGTRTHGVIEPGAMPALHRYFGSPATTMMFNLIYGTRFSDIHCGMRAITLSALKRMELESPGWEYASEMILKARRLGMRTTEVPVRFWKDRGSRGPREPPEARRMANPLDCGLGQPARDVPVRTRLLPVASRRRPACGWRGSVGGSRCRAVLGPRRWIQSALDAVGDRRRDGWLQCRAARTPRARVLRL